MASDLKTMPIDQLTATTFRELFREEALDLLNRAQNENNLEMRAFFALEVAARLILIQLFDTLSHTDDGQIKWPTTVAIYNLRSQTNSAISRLTHDLGKDSLIPDVDEVISRADEILLEQRLPQDVERDEE